MRTDLLTTEVHRVGCGPQDVVLRAVGEVDLNTGGVLDAELEALAGTPGVTGVVCDLVGVGFFGSVGLTVLLAAHDRGRLAVVAPRRSAARRTLEISGLISVLVVADTVPDALLALSGGSGV